MNYLVPAVEVYTESGYSRKQRIDLPYSAQSAIGEVEALPLSERRKAYKSWWEDSSKIPTMRAYGLTEYALGAAPVIRTDSLFDLKMAQRRLFLSIAMKIVDTFVLNDFVNFSVETADEVIAAMKFIAPTAIDTISADDYRTLAEVNAGVQMFDVEARIAFNRVDMYFALRKVEKNVNVETFSLYEEVMWNAKEYAARADMSVGVDEAAEWYSTLAAIRSHGVYDNKFLILALRALIESSTINTYGKAPVPTVKYFRSFLVTFADWRRIGLEATAVREFAAMHRRRVLGGNSVVMSLISEKILDAKGCVELFNTAMRLSIHQSKVSPFLIYASEMTSREVPVAIASRLAVDKILYAKPIKLADVMSTWKAAKELCVDGEYPIELMEELFDVELRSDSHDYENLNIPPTPLTSNKTTR